MSEDFTMRPLGVIPSPPDSRDYSIDKLIACVPSTVEPDIFEYNYNDYIKDQGSIGECISASGSATREIKEKEQNGGIYKRFSVGFNYGYRPKSTDYKGVGMIPRDYLENLKDFGVPSYEMFMTEKEWPDIQQEVNNSNISEILKNALPRKITGYARAYTPEEIKLALRTLGPLMIVVPVYQSFYSVSATNPIVPKYNSSKEHLYGSHALCLLGYDNNKKLYKVANSWGKKFAENGFCYFSYDWPFSEIWVITDTELSPEPQPKPNYSLSVTSDKNTYNTGELINININTSIPSQQITTKFIRPSNSLPFSPTLTTNNVGEFVLPFVETVSGQFDGEVNWEDPNGDIQTATISIQIVKVEIDKYTITTDKESYTSPINTPINISVKVENNDIPLENQAIQLIYLGVINGGSSCNTDSNGIATFTVNSDKIGDTNCTFVWFDKLGVKHQVIVKVSWTEEIKPEPEPNPIKKLWHVQTVPINSNKIEEIEAQIEELKALGFNVYSTISIQVSANGVEQYAKANSDKLTAKGIKNIILYY